MTNEPRTWLYVASATSEVSGFVVLALQEARRRRRAARALEDLHRFDPSWGGYGPGFQASMKLAAEQEQTAVRELKGSLWTAVSISLFVVGSVLGLVANLHA